MEEFNLPTSIMQKTQSELTVADNLKITVVIAAALVAIPVAFVAVCGAVSAAVNFRKNRKAEKIDPTVPTPEVEV